MVRSMYGMANRSNLTQISEQERAGVVSILQHSNDIFLFSGRRFFFTSRIHRSYSKINVADCSILGVGASKTQITNTDEMITYML